MIRVLVLALYKLFTELPSSFSSFLTFSFFPYAFFLFIYFVTGLLPGLSIYSFQNRLVPFPGQRL